MDDHIRDLILGAVRLVTVNSGTGFEALMHGRPVICCGASDYHHLTTRVRSEAELQAALDIVTEPPDRPTRARYALWFHDQLVDLSREGWADEILVRLRASATATSALGGA